jgi:hypothetical protein
MDTIARTRNQLPQGFEHLNLTPSHFHIFHTVFIGLRFPLNVSEVLDLRYLINHAVDEYTEPPLTADYRQFRDSLDKALDSFSIENPRHRDRLLKILAMIRDLHVSHSLESRYAEERIKLALADNRERRREAIRNGLLYLFTTALSVVAWFTYPEAAWLTKLLSLLCIVQSWLNFRALPRLDKHSKELRLQLNDVLRDRVNSVTWKTLIHKLALVLGFKQIKGVEVFRVDSEHADISSAYH